MQKHFETLCFVTTTALKQNDWACLFIKAGHAIMLAYSLIPFYLDNGKNVAADPEADIAACERHTIDASVVVVIARTRVLGKYTAQCISLFSGEGSSHLHRHLHLQRLPLLRVDEAAAGLGMAVGIGDVGLHVENGRTIHQVGSQHMQHRTEAVVHFNAV